MACPPAALIRLMSLLGRAECIGLGEDLPFIGIEFEAFRLPIDVDRCEKIAFSIDKLLDGTNGDFRKTSAGFPGAYCGFCHDVDSRVRDGYVVSIAADCLQ